MMIKKLNSSHYTLIFLVFSLFLSVFLEIKGCWIRNAQDDYGFTYNTQRKKLRIPIIPKHWHIKERDEEFIWWTDKESTIGHSWKTVTFSGGSIDGETDVYTLPIQNRKGRWLYIEYKYGIKPHPDTIVCRYQIGDTANEISRNVADSIFKAEKINKDY